jgi:gamma-glutamyl-gamma-aminobutyraldehyde dehydrogenase
MSIRSPSISSPTQAFIDGRFVDALSGATFDTCSPANGALVASIAACDEPDVERAVSAARRAFDDGRWRRAAPVERKRVLLRFADLVEQHAAEVSLLDVLEAGKPITDVEELDTPDSINTLRWNAEMADKLFGQVAPTAPDHLALIVREPIGVVGAVLPWNFPGPSLAWKLGPALAAGNSVVVKPAELTSLSALRLAELAAEAGLPEGVLNVVPGLGPTAGRAVGLNMDVDVVSFTGSTEVGREFLRYAADSNLKEVVLECGGKSPQIVMADGARDLEYLAGHLAQAAFWNMGENCTCGSRLLVQGTVRDDVLDALVAAVPYWRVGDPLERSTRIGPLIEEAHLEKVVGYVEDATSKGARVVCGGRRVLEESGGWYFEPTVLEGVNSRMALLREEVFGPVVSVSTFSTEAEAVALANDTDYGLAASIYTSDIDVARRMAYAVRAGTVSVNCYSEGDVTTPFGGYKTSGFGGRDKGLAAFEQYTQLKTIWFGGRQVNQA